MSKLHRAMFVFIIVFLSSMFWPALPTKIIILILAITGALCFYFHATPWITGAIVGFIWAGSVGHWYSSWQLPNQYFNENVIIEGNVETLHILQNNPMQFKNTNNGLNPPLDNDIKNTQVFSDKPDKKINHSAFILKLSRIGKTSLINRPKVRLSWFAPSIVWQQGDKLKLLVNLKRPHALANEFGFNKQKWLASQNIVGIGSVKRSPSNTLLRVNKTLRQHLANNLVELADKLKLTNTRWVLALALGERSLFEAEDWTLLQSTGTAHLFAISGLHMGIVCWLFYSATKAVLFSVDIGLKRVAQANQIPLALLLSVPFGFIYAYLSGFQVPVIRASIALFFVAYLMIFQLHWRPVAVMLTLLVCFFITYPLSILSTSFWFSYGAVMSIWFYVWRFPNKVASHWQTLKQNVGIQLFLSLAMLPLVAISFGVVSFISPIVNLIVLPVVSLLIVPLCLLLIAFLALDLTCLSTHLLIILEWFFEKLIQFMQVMQLVPFATFDLLHLSSTFWYLCLFLFIFVCIPYWPNRRYIIVLLGLGVLAQGVIRVKESHRWSVRVFDIGQGLSVLVRQSEQYLLYDTGQSFLNGASMANSVIHPYFLANEVTDDGAVPNIDYLINSHFDNDHAGGNTFIFSNYNVRLWLSPEQGCTSNDSFKWGELTLTMLWPQNKESGEENNHSCVISISDSYHRVLLTGDIERESEQELVNIYGNTNHLKSNVLISPHHGSKTSSTLPFIRAVSPQYITISSKYYNQWRFPHVSVLENYDKVDATVFNTAYDGEILFTFDGESMDVNTHRNTWLSPWYMQLNRQLY